MLAASGVTLAAGAPVVLAACGTEEDEDASPEREAELLNLVLAQQLAVIDALDATSNSTPDQVQGALVRLYALRQQSSRALEMAIADLGGTPTDEPAEPASQAESAVEGAGRQLEASIAASLGAIGELSAEQREPVHTAIVEDAGVLAEVRLVLGEDPAPDAFVMGPPTEVVE